MLQELEVTVEDEERGGSGGGFPRGAREAMGGQDFLEVWGEAEEEETEGLSLEGAAGCEVDAVLGSGRQAE